MHVFAGRSSRTIESWIVSWLSPELASEARIGVTGRALTFACSLLGVLIWCGPAYATSSGFECLIEPYEVVEIRSPVEGVIEKVNVKRGDVVRKDQVLTQLVSDVDRAAAESAKYRAQMEGRI